MLPSAWLPALELDKLSQHNLAARVLANTVCPDFNILEKDEYGKPYFDSADYKISISHSGEYAAFMYCETEDCGIDMEQITTRVERIVSKFFREDEKEYLEHNLSGMYMVWCAKEALYKYYGLKSLDFRDHMKIDYAPIEQSGRIQGHIKKGDYEKTVQLDYEFFNEYLLVNTVV